jgi:hypothetical protein
MTPPPEQGQGIHRQFCQSFYKINTRFSQKANPSHTDDRQFPHRALTSEPRERRHRLAPPWTTTPSPAMPTATPTTFARSSPELTSLYHAQFRDLRPQPREARRRDRKGCSRHSLADRAKFASSPRAVSLPKVSPENSQSVHKSRTFARAVTTSSTAANHSTSTTRAASQQHQHQRRSHADAPAARKRTRPATTTAISNAVSVEPGSTPRTNTDELVVKPRSKQRNANA